MAKNVDLLLAFLNSIRYNYKALTLGKLLLKAGRRKIMKQGIHPKYNRIIVKCSTCGNEFETGSTAKELRVVLVQTVILSSLEDNVSQLHKDELKSSIRNTALRIMKIRT